MCKQINNFFYFILFFCLLFTPISADEWYAKAAKLHKEWAKTYHNESDLERYTNIHKSVIGKNIKLKPGKVLFNGYPSQLSMKVNVKNGAMAEVIGAEDFAYNGKTFYSFTADFSKCKKISDHNDCTHHNGSVRTELNTLKSKKTFSEGTEKWINYAFMPAHNILFPKEPRRKFTIGQCHPGGDKITWMMTIQYATLIIAHEFTSFKNNNNEWKPTTLIKKRNLKKFIPNDYHGTKKWTNVRINFKNSKRSDGKLKIWIDGKLTYDYEGPTNWGKKKHKGVKRNKCRFKFGLYTNANLRAENRYEAEGMTIFADYMAMAKTEGQLEELLLKDK